MLCGWGVNYVSVVNFELNGIQVGFASIAGILVLLVFKTSRNGSFYYDNYLPYI